MPIKEADYLYASGRIRALEASLLNRERALRMLEARTPEDAFRLLGECGYAPIGDISRQGLEQLLSAKRTWLFDTLGAILPDPQLIQYFKLRYDCHNAKVLIKANFLQLTDQAHGLAAEQPSHYELPLQDFGTIAAQRLLSMMREGDLRALPKGFATAIEEAAAVLARTSDPQLMELHLDRYCLQAMLDTAIALDSPMLIGYSRLYIDNANLRLILRLQRMGNQTLDLAKALSPGGHRSPTELTRDLEALKSRTTTEVDHLCDNALIHYLQPAKALAFGHPIAVAYLAAVEAEIDNARSLLSGKLAGLPVERLRERLRDTYV